jgi:hypothetical protein
MKSTEHPIEYAGEPLVAPPIPPEMLPVYERKPLNVFMPQHRSMGPGTTVTFVFDCDPVYYHVSLVGTTGARATCILGDSDPVTAADSIILGEGGYVTLPALADRVTVTNSTGTNTITVIAIRGIADFQYHPGL